MNPVTQQARPLRADAKRNRERVLAAARTVLAEQGFEAQMTDIARAAEVGVGTVYRHFPDKTALVEALVAERFTQFAKLAQDALAADDAWAGFRDWLMRCGEIQADDRMVCDFLAEALGGDRVDAIAEEVGLAAINRDVVERAKREGALRRTVEPEDVPTMMCGIGAIARSGVDQRHGTWRRHLEFMLEGMRDPDYQT